AGGRAPIRRRARRAPGATYGPTAAAPPRRRRSPRRRREARGCRRAAERVPSRFRCGSPSRSVARARLRSRRRPRACGRGPRRPFMEALREPFRDTDFASRKGYDPDFLNAPGQDASLGPVQVPLPQAADQTVLAKARDGGTLLAYENFSVAMHGARRLALFTASKVTKEPQLRRPDPNADYSRRGLSGLGPNDQEKWYTDPRLDEKFQLPDIFFTKDRGSFDKGHIVRREDVAWGSTFDILRRANGDTYHVTNCSPQVAGFNRSNAGEDNWGDLENVVLAEAANERLCLFAGPVLNAA